MRMQRNAFMYFDENGQYVADAELHRQDAESYAIIESVLNVLDLL
jgi:hypothetical protein